MWLYIHHTESCGSSVLRPKVHSELTYLYIVCVGHKPYKLCVCVLILMYRSAVNRTYDVK